MISIKQLHFVEKSASEIGYYLQGAQFIRSTEYRIGIDNSPIHFHIFAIEALQLPNKLMPNAIFEMYFRRKTMSIS